MPLLDSTIETVNEKIALMHRHHLRQHSMIINDIDKDIDIYSLETASYSPKSILRR